MLVDCGAGVTEAVVISLGGICVSRSARGGGNALDQALIDHINFHHRFQIGFPTAELLKLQLSGALANAGSQWIEVRGLDTTNGLPRTLSLPVKGLAPVWTRHLDEIVQLVRDVLGKTSPELSQDILEDGITLTGGGALSGLLATRITEETGVRAAVAQNSRHCVAFGLQRLLEERMREVPGGSASPSDTKRRVN
jgi:rod shape-determining protein MreB